MNRYILIAAIVSILSIVLAWQHITILELSENLAVSNHSNSLKQATITGLHAQKALLKKSQQKLATDLQQNRATVIKQIKQLRELEYENQDYRDWARQFIPNAVVGLQQRPTITGSEHYRQYLRNRDPLPTQPNKTGHQ